MHKYNVHMLTHLPDVVRRFGPLITNSAYQVENTIGQIAKKVKTGAKVAEQVLRKSLISTSILVQLYNKYDQLSEDFKEIVARDYFPNIWSLPDKPKIADRNYALSQNELSLLVNVVENRDPLGNIERMDKIAFNNYAIHTESYNSSHNNDTNNQYVRTKAGGYYMVRNIIRIGGDVYLFCNEFVNLEKYQVTDSIYFDHIKYTESSNLSMSDLKLVRFCDIECLFAVLFLFPFFYIFDLFNCHL